MNRNSGTDIYCILFTQKVDRQAWLIQIQQIYFFNQNQLIMKKNFIWALTLFCSIASLSTSCNKSQKGSSTQEQRLENVQLMPLLEQRKVTYGLLSPQEKAFIWKLHLEDMIASVRYNSEQQLVIKEALAFLKEEHFASGSSFWKSNEFEIWKYKSAKVFNDEEKALLFNDIKKSFASVRISALLADTTGTDTTGTDSTGHGGSGGGDSTAAPKCSCSKSTDYCGIYNTGDACTGLFIWSCGGSSCTSTTTGCGTFWSYPCNGTCTSTFIPGMC